MNKRPTVTTDALDTPLGLTVLDTKAARRVKNELANQLQILLDTAYELGFVLTVETQPLPDFAMRNYRMVGNVRMAR